jgi:hypothetical protein
MTANVTNNTAAQRYELAVDGDVAIAAYERDGDTVVLTHTEVPPTLEGQGVGSRLIAAVLDDVRRQGQHVVAACSFVAAYVERHPDQQDLLA